MNSRILDKNEIFILCKSIDYIKERPIVKPDSCLVKTKNNQTFNDFCKNVMQSYSISNLKIFHHNISNLKISYVHDFDKYNKNKCCKKIGHYITKQNKIEIIKDSQKGVLIHELYHAISSYYDKNAEIMYCGFHQLNSDNNIDIGVGLNEGYTEYLTEQYCQKHNLPNMKKIYLNEKKYAAKIESIIGSKKMLGLYLTSDLRGLINELSKYESKENAIAFLLDLDTLHKDFLTKEVTLETMVEDIKKCDNYIDKVSNNYKESNKTSIFKQ